MATRRSVQVSKSNFRLLAGFPLHALKGSSGPIHDGGTAGYSRPGPVLRPIRENPASSYPSYVLVARPRSYEEVQTPRVLCQAAPGAEAPVSARLSPAVSPSRSQCGRLLGSAHSATDRW